MIWKLKIFFTCQTWPFTITRFLWSPAPWIMCCIPGTWHDYLTVTGTIVQWLTRFFNSCWHHCSTDTGTIVQQSLAGLFNSGWQDYLSVAGTIVQQSLAPLFNSHGQDFFLFLCWQNSSTVMFIVEESCHVPGIGRMIQGARLHRNWFYCEESCLTGEENL